MRRLIMQQAVVPTAPYQPALFDMAIRIDRFFNRRSSPTAAELYLLASADETWLELPGSSMSLPRLKEERKYVIGLTTITYGNEPIWQQPPPLPSVNK